MDSGNGIVGGILVGAMWWRRGRLELFSIRERRGDHHLGDEAGRELIGDNPPSINDEVKEDELELCLRAPMWRSVRSTTLFMCSLTNSEMMNSCSLELLVFLQ